MDVEVIRAFERLLVVAFSGASIILGWHLFKIGVVSPQSGSLSGKGFKITLLKVGPGIFFSLFGSIVLSISLIYGLKTVEISTTQDGVKKKEFSLANTIQETGLSRLTKSINTLDLIDLDNTARYESHRKAIRTAVERLRAHRDVLARNKFSKERLDEYQKCIDSKDAACKLANSYKEVESWITDTLLQQ